VTVVDTSTSTVLTTIPVGADPIGIAVNRAGTQAYVANSGIDEVSVIDTSDSVVATVAVGTTPIAFGDFIGAAGAAPSEVIFANGFEG